MAQTFEYPNLLAGTRAAGGLATNPHGDAIPRVALASAPAEGEPLPGGGCSHER